MSWLDQILDQVKRGAMSTPAGVAGYAALRALGGVQLQGDTGGRSFASARGSTQFDPTGGLQHLDPPSTAQWSLPPPAPDPASTDQWAGAAPLKSFGSARASVGGGSYAREMERLAQEAAAQANRPPRMEIPAFDANQLFAKLLQQAIAGMGPAPAGPNQADYVGPYDEMLQRLTTAVSQNASAIEGQLPQMRQAQQRITDEGRQQFNQVQQNLQANNANADQAVRSAEATMRQQQGGAQANQALAAIQAAQASRQGNANEYASRIQTQANNAANGRQALADGLVQAARATLHANSVAGQNQIGVGRANAMRAFNADQIKHQDMLRQRDAAARAAAQQRVDRMLDIYTRDRTAVDDWNRTMDEAYAPIADPMANYRSRGDGHSRAVTDIMSRLDTGEVSLAGALNILRSEEGQQAVQQQYGGDVDTNALVSDVARIYQEAQKYGKEKAGRDSLKNKPKPNVSILQALKSIGV